LQPARRASMNTRQRTQPAPLPPFYATAPPSPPTFCERPPSVRGALATHTTYHVPLPRDATHYATGERAGWCAARLAPPPSLRARCLHFAPSLAAAFFATATHHTTPLHCLPHCARRATRGIARYRGHRRRRWRVLRGWYAARRHFPRQRTLLFVLYAACTARRADYLPPAILLARRCPYAATRCALVPSPLR